MTPRLRTSKLWRLAFGLALWGGLVVAGLSTQAAAGVPCIAFVHGHWYDNSDSASVSGSPAEGDYGWGLRTSDVYWRVGAGYQGGTNMYTGWGSTTAGSYGSVAENGIKTNNVGTLYWRIEDNGDAQGNFIYYATNGYAVDFGVVNFNSHKYYWDMGAEVAGDLMKVCSNNSWVVTHSTGGRIMAWIMGNSVSGDAYYNYAGADYAGVRNKYLTWFSVSAPLGGSEAAESVCGGLAEFFGVSHCCKAVQSLQHGWSPQYENGTRIASLLVVGYEAMIGSGTLQGEDDGVINYAEGYFCDDQPDDSNSVGYDNFCSGLEDVDTGLFDGCGDNPSNKCQGNGGSSAYHKRKTGYRNYDAADEDHDELRNGREHGDERRAVADGYWGGTPGNDYSWTGSTADEIGWFVSNGYSALSQ